MGEALLFYSKGQAVYEDIGNAFALGVANNNIGAVHFKAKRYQEAFLSMQESFKIQGGIVAVNRSKFSNKTPI